VYNNRQEFMTDIELMVNNCREYNTTRNPHMVPQAEAILEFARNVVFEQVYDNPCKTFIDMSIDAR